LHTDLLKPGEDHNDRKAMLLTDPPIGIVFMVATYHGPTADDETTETCTNVTAGACGVTARDVLRVAYAFSMMSEIAKGKGAAVIKEILIDAREAIWVTAAEKLKVEKEGQLTIPKLSVDSSRWLVLTVDEQLKVKEENQVAVSIPEADSNPWLVLTEEPKKSTLPYDA
jgi:hypothetical protein